MKLLTAAVLTGVLILSGAQEVRAEDKPKLTTWDFAESCAPITGQNFCVAYIEALIDAQLELKAQGKLSGPVLCGYADAELPLKEIVREMSRKGVDPGSPAHDPAFAASPAARFVYGFLAKKFPCPSP